MLVDSSGKKHLLDFSPARMQTVLSFIQPNILSDRYLGPNVQRAASSLSSSLSELVERPSRHFRILYLRPQVLQMVFSFLYPGALSDC